MIKSLLEFSYCCNKRCPFVAAFTDWFLYRFNQSRALIERYFRLRVSTVEDSCNFITALELHFFLNDKFNYSDKLPESDFLKYGNITFFY